MQYDSDELKPNKLPEHIEPSNVGATILRVVLWGSKQINLFPVFLNFKFFLYYGAWERSYLRSTSISFKEENSHVHTLALVGNSTILR